MKRVSVTLNYQVRAMFSLVVFNAYYVIYKETLFFQKKRRMHITLEK